MSTPATDARPETLADEALVRKAVASAPRPTRASRASAALTFGWRGMLKVKHVPEQLLDVTITPVMFVLMFTYLFGGAISGSTGEYLDYILPGILVMSVLFTTVYSGIALNTDLTKGVVDRFRSLPIWRPAPLLGALLGDSVRYVLAGTVIIVLGVILGYRPEAGPAGVIAALALVVVFAFGLSWVFTTLGPVLRSPNAVMNAGFMGIFPLTFLSNVFVEPETLPAGLEAFVNVNPISILADASRGLMEGNAVGSDIAIVLGGRGAADRDLHAADDAALRRAYAEAADERGASSRSRRRTGRRGRTFTARGTTAGALVLGHGAGGSVDAPDLVAATEAAVAAGFTVALVEQPYQVAGKRNRLRPEARRGLDRSVAELRDGELEGLPLIAGGRSAGARVACRTAAESGAAAVLCLAFPVHPPGKPEKSRHGELDAVSVPVLVVQGESDPFGMPKAARTARSSPSPATTG